MSLPQAALTCFHHSGRHHHPSLYALHSIAWYGILMSARSAVWYWSRFRLQVMSKPCSAKNSFSFLQVSRSYAAPLLRESTMGSTSKVLAILLQIGVPCKRISNGGSLDSHSSGRPLLPYSPTKGPPFSIFIKNGREPAKLLRT
jgi:hypothetical protein